MLIGPPGFWVEKNLRARSTAGQCRGHCCNPYKSDGACPSWVAAKVGEGFKTWTYVKGKSKDFPMDWIWEKRRTKTSSRFLACATGKMECL